MRITIPDLPQLAQTRTTRPTSLAVDTRGLQTLAGTTEAAFQAASNAANEFWKLELQENENVELAAAVTQYGAGLDDASSQAAVAPPTKARTVFETAAAEVLANVRGGITNKQALLRFNLNAAGKYTARATEERKLARTRILEGKVFRIHNQAQELIRTASDIDASVLERNQAMIGLFGRDVEGLPKEIGLYEKAVLESVYDGEKAADALQDARVQIVTNLATGLVMQSDDPELTAMRLQQVDPRFAQTDEEEQIHSMLADLKPTAREEVMAALVNSATERATDQAARLTRDREAENTLYGDMYNDAFDPDLPLDKLYQMRNRLEQWTGFTPAFREALRDHIATRAFDGPIFGNVDIGISIVSIQDKLSTQTLTAAELARHQGNLTQATYEKFRGAIRTQNQDGFASANDLIMREFRYEKYKQANTDDPLVRASQAAAQNAQAEMLRWLQANLNATPADAFAQAEKLIKEERLGFRVTILQARQVHIASVQSILGGAFTTDDPVAELEARFALPTDDPKYVAKTQSTLMHLQILRDYAEQLGDD